MNDIRPVIFGEVLFDIFPDGSEILGGAPFNVAWHLQALGMNPLFISRIGNDSLGEAIIQKMTKWGMDISAIQKDAKHNTGIVQIKLNNGQPDFVIMQDCAYDFIDEDKIPTLPRNIIFYHGSLALRNIISQKSFKKLHSQALGSVFVDINLRPPWYKLKNIISIIEKAKWLKLNENELHKITKHDNENNAIRSALKLQKNMNLELIVITQGAKGAFAIDNKCKITKVHPKNNMKVIDTVGAGDAFSSVCIVGLIRQWDLSETLKRAQNFASAIVGRRGATVDDVQFYSSFIKNWSL